MNTKIASLSVLLFTVLLTSSAFSAAAVSTNSSNAPMTFPRGTICGDAQLGQWSANQFNGHSDYQHFYSLFTVNKMMLSGGNKGTVTSTSGTLSVYNHKGGTLLFYATYSGGMKGSYRIRGTSMYLTGFTAGTIHVYLNMIHGHHNDHQVDVGSYHNAHVPDVVLPCTTQDAMVSYYG